MTQLVLFIVTFVAYFIKGFSGFGPALLIVPFFTLFAGAPIALTASALLDALAGLILLWGIRKKIDWKFTMPIIVAISVGSFVGARLIFVLPILLLKKLIGIFLSIFILYLIWNPDFRHPFSEKRLWPVTLLVSLVSGISGGLVGMSGPPLAAYLKFRFPKDYFRAQLIVVFFFEKLIRLFVYHTYQLIPTQQWTKLIWFLPVLLLGLWVGTHYHARIGEKKFTRIVAFILLIPAIKLIFF